jgi:hypothetical protein
MGCYKGVGWVTQRWSLLGYLQRWRPKSKTHTAIWVSIAPPPARPTQKTLSPMTDAKRVKPPTGRSAYTRRPRPHRLHPWLVGNGTNPFYRFPATGRWSTAAARALRRWGRQRRDNAQDLRERFTCCIFWLRWRGTPFFGSDLGRRLEWILLLHSVAADLFWVLSPPLTKELGKKETIVQRIVFNDLGHENIVL